MLCGEIDNPEDRELISKRFAREVKGITE